MSFRYLPDLPPDTPNTWTVCDGFHADNQGNYRTGWLASSFLATGLTQNFSQMKFLPYGSTSGSNNIIAIRATTSSPVSAGVAYVYNGSSWNDRTGGTNVHTGKNESMAQYGAITLVGTPADGIFSRTASGTSNFAAIADSPNCDILLVNGLNIVIALGGNSDEWATSHTGDHTNWTTLNAASGFLYQTPGNITAGALIGRDVLAFKNRGVYRGSYVGGSTKWKWDLLDANLGAWGPGCAVEADGAVYFYGDRGFWRYDGMRFERLDDQGISATLLAFLGNTPIGTYVNAKLVYDVVNSRIALFRRGAQSNGVFTISAAHYTYNVRSGAWGYQSQAIDSGTDNYGAVVDGYLPAPTSGVLSHNSSIALFSSTNNDIRMLSTEFSSSVIGGSDYKPKLRTHRLGNRDRVTSVTRFIPHWTTSGGAGTDLTGATLKSAIPYISDSVMESEVAQTAVPLSTDQYHADFTHAARFISVELQLNCEAVIDGGSWISRDAGRN